MFSSARVPAVSVYPDSNKIGVWPGDVENELIFRRTPPCRGPKVRKAGSKPETALCQPLHCREAAGERASGSEGDCEPQNAVHARSEERFSARRRGGQNLLDLPQAEQVVAAQSRIRSGFAHRVASK
jgi:hypothetical protein